MASSLYADLYDACAEKENYFLKVSKMQVGYFKNWWVKMGLFASCSRGILLSCHLHSSSMWRGLDCGVGEEEIDESTIF